MTTAPLLLGIRNYGGGEDEDIFHNDIKVASDQHIQFVVLVLAAHDSNSQDSVSRKSSDNKLLVCKFTGLRGPLMTSQCLCVDLGCRFRLTSFCQSKENSTRI